MNDYDWEHGHGYVRHLEEQHRRLTKELCRLQEMLQTSGDTKTTILVQLEALRQGLAAHFREEEEGGCLEEAVCRCPSLAHEVRLIEAEHRELLEQLDALIATQRATGLLAAAELERFAAAINRHEVAEDHVLQRGFNLAADA